MGRKRILVMDDSKEALLRATTNLRRMPYELATAHDGEPAGLRSGGNDDITQPVDALELLAKVRGLIAR